jgi:hypothetical protein
MSKHSLLFPVLLLVIGAPFYLINLHSIHELNHFLADAVPQIGSVLDMVPPSRHQRDSFYLLQVENPSLREPLRVWATGTARPGIGDKVTFYYHPAHPQDARVIDGKEISRYEMEFLFPTFALSILVYVGWIMIEKEMPRQETVFIEF